MQDDIDLTALGLHALTWAGRFVLAGALALSACVAALALLLIWPAERGPIAALAQLGATAGLGWTFTLGGVFGCALAALVWRVEQ